MPINLKHSYKIYSLGESINPEFGIGPIIRYRHKVMHCTVMDFCKQLFANLLCANCGWHRSMNDCPRKKTSETFRLRNKPSIFFSGGLFQGAFFWQESFFPRSPVQHYSILQTND